MNPNKKQQLLNDYLEGNLSEEDLALLRKAKELNDPIIDDLRLSKKLIVGLKAKNRETIKDELTKLYYQSKKS